ncbi:putative DNA polymerase lambda [Glarea lozoyensis 74030]|uniref:DNA polymerase n=1 Tax=Glarea lozoyensis (strain ATCC 74030 / MF5533) TaxID=1104152 RepID=H0EG73_GLAL7|nr:putative DNA polymerase lambda [Glarea lozoyensis 74030]
MDSLSKAEYFDKLYALIDSSPDEAEDTNERNVKRKRIGEAVAEKSKKSSRVSDIKLVPENQRIFQDKTFFYIPNDAIASARKFRIDKARKYGATWTQEFGTGVTHVVVDKNLKYQDVLAYMKSSFNVDGIPEDMMLVNELYPLECIEHRFLVPPDQKLYMVEGSESVLGQKEQPPILNPKAGNLVDVRLPKEDSEERPGTPVVEEATQETSPSESLPKALNNTSDGTEVIDNPPPRKYADFGTEFNEVINIARNTRFVALDDEESDSRLGPDNSEDSDSEREASQAKAVAKSKKRPRSRQGGLHKDNFSCMKGGTGSASGKNPNDDCINAFLELAAFYERIRDTFRNMSYRKGATALRSQTRKITDYDEAREIFGIGHSLATKIVEFHRRGRLAKLEYTKLDGRDSIVQKFMKIYGVGASQADKWVDQGHKTLEDLVANVPLTENQKIGIAHYEDFNIRIPREEMHALGDIVKQAVAKIDPKVEATMGGSYRRGAKTSGDIDFMLTKPGTTSTLELLPFLHSLVTYLQNTGFLVAALAVPSYRSADAGSKWHGACKLPDNPIWRRIDLLLVPASEWGAALIYFTGDDIFNRSLRLLASKYDMRLNQRGLYEHCMRGKGRVKLTEGTLIKGLDERGIFERLGVPWRPPEERILN